MEKIFNRSCETEMRRHLRNKMPPAETLIWINLRRRQLLGAKFRRQYSVGSYCIDFYCPESKLAIEIDGDSHFTPDAKLYDLRRQDFIESFGIRVLRFTNQDVYENLDGVLETIANAILTPPSERGDGLSLSWIEADLDGGSSCIAENGISSHTTDPHSDGYSQGPDL